MCHYLFKKIKWCLFLKFYSPKKYLFDLNMSYFSFAHLMKNLTHNYKISHFFSSIILSTAHCLREWESSWTTWVQITTPPFTSLMAQGRSLTCCISQFCHLQNGGNNGDYVLGLLWELNELILIRLRPLCLSVT